MNKSLSFAFLILIIGFTRINAQNEFKTYQNYDFIPGEKILFEDNFTTDEDGEFPAHWKLKAGQGVVNKINDTPAFLLTEGSYAVVYPRMKNEKYLGDEFTVEFDFQNIKVNNTDSYPIIITFYYFDEIEKYERDFKVTFSQMEATLKDINKEYPEDLRNGFGNKWHHAAIIFKKGQMKTYLDQYRLLVNPDIECKPYRLAFNGLASESNPIVFTNVKIAEGGGMNVIGEKFTGSKIVTHGINFDINKSTIKPESMGTLNGIVKILKNNPELNFEIGGHTDNTGTKEHNLSLSQQRAEAVKTQLIQMGIEASRLTTKGYGDAVPLSDNSTIEGRANNRRVEFVKL